MPFTESGKPKRLKAIRQRRLTFNSAVFVMSPHAQACQTEADGAEGEQVACLGNDWRMDAFL